jgi:anti-sigma factor (TIGR02949 family)
MNCEHAQQRLRDLADHELPRTEAAEIEQHASSCSSCTAALQTELNLKHVLRARFRHAPAPARLSGGIARHIRTAAGEPVERRWVLSLVVAVAAVLAAVLLRPSPVPAPSPMAAALIDDHIHMLSAPGAGVEFAAADLAEAERWFGARLQFPVLLPRFTSPGMQLLGARVCSVMDRPVALLFLGSAGHRLSLFVMDGTGMTAVAPPPEDPVQVRRAIESARGFHVACWRKHSLMFGLVADASQDDLASLVASAYPP